MCHGIQGEITKGVWQLLTYLDIMSTLSPVSQLLLYQTIAENYYYYVSSMSVHGDIKLFSIKYLQQITVTKISGFVLGTKPLVSRPMSNSILS